ncbi:hypothetical protein D3C73_453810 [compost metagenome]
MLLGQSLIEADRDHRYIRNSKVTPHLTLQKFRLNDGLVHNRVERLHHFIAG